MRTPVDTSARQTDARNRLAYLSEAAARLWPGSTVDVRRNVGGDFLLLPNAGSPRLLVPAGHPKAAAAAVRGYGEQAGRRERAKARLLSAGLRVGAAQLLLRDRVHVTGGGQGLPGFLGDLLGAEVLVSLHLGPPRANRKPVLQLLRSDGHLLGFAKVGVDELTRRLVSAESIALHRLSSVELPGLITPDVVHSGQWNGLEVLVQSPLAIQGRRRAHDEPALNVAMSAVADLDRSGPVTVVGSDYWSALCARVGRLPDGPAAAQLAGLLNRLRDVAPTDKLSLGSWHGDWTPWNMANLPAGLAVWDWERFATGVPIGFDPLHFDLQRDIVAGRRDPSQAVAALVDTAPARLHSFGVDRRAAVLTALYYLIELSTRYTEDGQADAGAHFGRVQDWLLPVLLSRVEGLTR